MSERICVDASVAVKWLLPEDFSQKAIDLLNDSLRTGRVLTGPPHLPVEVTSAIYKRYRAGAITLTEARERLDALAEIPLDLVYPSGIAQRALELAAEFGWILPYDAFYLAVAEILDCEVWTADEEFDRDASASYPRVRPLSSYGSS